MSEHTPGPWIVSGESIVSDEMEICIANIERDGGYEALAPERDANARLIAAAPDLLAACKLAKKFLEPDLVEPGRTVFWALVGVIKKAEGSAE